MPVNPQELNFEDIMDVNDPDFNQDSDDEATPHDDVAIDTDEDDAVEEEATDTKTKNKKDEKDKSEDQKVEDDSTDEEVEVDVDEDDEDDEKEEVVDEESEDDDFDLFGEINKTIGIELEGEFEDSVEGLAHYVDKAAEQRAVQELERLPDDIKNYIRFRQSGGDPEQYFDQYYNETDWADVQIDSDNEQQQELIVKQSLKAQGYDENDIEEQIEEFKAAGILENKAKRDVKYLQKQQEQERQQLAEEQERKAQEKKQQVEEFWNNTKEVIKSKNQFEGIPLTNAEKDEFFEFIAKDTGDGMTERDKRTMDMSLEEKLAIDLILFKGFETLEDLVDKRARTKKSKSLSDKLRRNSSRNLKDSSNRTNETKTGDNVDIDNLGDLSSILS